VVEQNFFWRTKKFSRLEFLCGGKFFERSEVRGSMTAPRGGLMFSPRRARLILFITAPRGGLMFSLRRAGLILFITAPRGGLMFSLRRAGLILFITAPRGGLMFSLRRAGLILFITAPRGRADIYLDSYLTCYGELAQMNILLLRSRRSVEHFNDLLLFFLASYGEK
jgi:hypothetical protein